MTCSGSAVALVTRTIGPDHLCGENKQIEGKMDAGSRDSSTCLELALEGERLCKGGDFAGGIAFFEAAIKVGTTDMRTLSAIYSQLGNAYFYLNNYEKALNFHQLDLAIAKSVSPVTWTGTCFRLRSICRCC